MIASMFRGAESPTLEDASSGLRRALIEVGRVRQLGAREVVVEEGQRGDAFFLVLAGQLKMSRLTPAGKNLILSLLGPGQVFGVAGAFDGSPSCVTVTALTAARCAQVRRSELYALVSRRPSLVEEVLPLLTGHLRECSNCLVEASCSRVETRFAQLFLRLAERLGEPVPGGELVPLAFSRQELADLTGTTLETAIRVMSRWRKQGLVETRRDGFVLRDRRTLEELGRE